MQFVKKKMSSDAAQTVKKGTDRRKKVTPEVCTNIEDCKEKVYSFSLFFL